MASNLCNLHFTWDSDKSPSSITKFTYLDRVPAHNVEIGNGEMESTRLIEDIAAGPETLLWLTRSDSDDSSNHCTLQMTCPDPDFARINGFVIVSESRTLEISCEEKGYLTSVRGKKLDLKCQDYTRDPSEGLSSSHLFICSCHFEGSHPGLTVKFLSLGNRSAFCVQAVQINIIQHGRKPTNKSSLDVDKLRKDIEDMGSTMSDRAKDFMATLEQYEKNKLAMTNGLLYAHSLSNSTVETTPNGNGISSIMNTILGTSTVKSLAGMGKGSNGDHDIFKILNSVCGSVSSQRIASAKQKEQLSETVQDGIVTTEEKKSADDIAISEKLSTLVANQMSELKSNLQDQVSEIRQEMLTKIEDVRTEMNQKLDLIIKILENKNSEPR